LIYFFMQQIMELTIENYLRTNLFHDVVIRTGLSGHVSLTRITT